MSLKFELRSFALFEIGLFVESFIYSGFPFPDLKSQKLILMLPFRLLFFFLGSGTQTRALAMLHPQTPCLLLEVLVLDLTFRFVFHCDLILVYNVR